MKLLFVEMEVEILLIVTFLLDTVIGHARLWDPPSRSTMWRQGFKTPVNPNDNELNCGGYAVNILNFSRSIYNGSIVFKILSRET